MKNSSYFYSICLVSFLILPACLFNSGVLLSEIIQADAQSTFLWHDRLNIIYNSFFSWKISSAVYYISSALNYYISAELTFEYWISLLIFYSGCLYYLRQKSDGEFFAPFLLSLVLACSLVYCFDYDSSVLHSLAIFFWALSAFENFLRADKASPYLTIAVLLCVYYIADSSNQLSFLLYITIVYLTSGNFDNISLNKRLFLVFSGIALLVYTYFIPPSMSPSYPPFSRVVPDDNIPGNIMPLFGPYPSIPFINRSIVKGIFLTPSILFSIFGVSLFIFKHSLNKILYLFCFLSMCCLLDSSLPENIALISPLYTLNRLIPGLFYLPLLPFTASIALCLLIVLTFHNRKFIFPALCIISAIIFLRQVIPDRAKVLNQLEKQLNDSLINSAEYKRIYNLLVSPSYNLIYERGLSILNANYTGLTEVVLNRDEITHIFASHNADEKQLNRIFRKGDKSRWSPQLGMQSGEEWIEFSLNKSRLIKGIFPDCGKFSTDYPRGLLIKYSEDCSADNGRLSGYFRTIFEAKDWQGSVGFTSQGHPYYSSQSEVKVLFDRPVNARCIQIFQTAKSRQFDWSIAELKLIE